MKKVKNKAWKHFILVTFLFLFVALDLLVLDSMLKFNRAFLYGVFSGMFTVWVVFTLFHIREIRKPGYRMDERMKFIIRTSGFYAFIVFDLYYYFSHSFKKILTWSPLIMPWGQVTFFLSVVSFFGY